MPLFLSKRKSDWYSLVLPKGKEWLILSCVYSCLKIGIIVCIISSMHKCLSVKKNLFLYVLSMYRFYWLFFKSTMNFVQIWLDLWHPWGECLDDKGWEWWRRTLGSCLLVTWSSSFAQGKEGPSVMEKGILISIWICFSLTKDRLFFFSLVYSWVFFIVWGYTFSVSIVCIEIVDWRVCAYVHASSDLQITLFWEWSTTKIPTCFLV